MGLLIDIGVPAVTTGIRRMGKIELAQILAHMLIDAPVGSHRPLLPLGSERGLSYIHVGSVL